MKEVGHFHGLEGTEKISSVGKAVRNIKIGRPKRRWHGNAKVDH
jgi:hypothetical protein